MNAENDDTSAVEDAAEDVQRIVDAFGPHDRHGYRCPDCGHEGDRSEFARDDGDDGEAA